MSQPKSQGEHGVVTLSAISAPRDASTAEIAVLDPVGTITAVNDAWTRYCLDSGGDPSLAGVGVSYLDICSAAPDEQSQVIASAIRAALAGDLPAPTTVTITCAGEHDSTDFDVLIAARWGPDATSAGAVVTLTPVHEDDSDLHRQVTSELLAVGVSLHELIDLQTDPARTSLSAEHSDDLRDVVGRLWTALLGAPQARPKS